MKIDLVKVRHLRDKLGVPLMAIKDALIACEGDVIEAEKHLLLNWSSSNKEAGFGFIHSYVHQGRIGVMVEVRCGTDFAANTSAFRDLCFELGYQLTGGLPGDLLEQAWVRDPSVKISELIDKASKQIGESIRIARHIRWEV